MYVYLVPLKKKVSHSSASQGMGWYTVHGALYQDIKKREVALPSNSIEMKLEINFFCCFEVSRVRLIAIDTLNGVM